MNLGSVQAISTTFPQGRYKFFSGFAIWVLPKTENENLRLSMLQTLPKCLNLDLPPWSRSSFCECCFSEVGMIYEAEIEDVVTL